LDQIDPESDRRIADHVIRGHRYRPDHGQSGHDSDFDDEDSDDDGDKENRVHSVWQRNRQVVSSQSSRDPHAHDMLQHDFLRKYMHFAKTRMKPVLTDRAREFIAYRYAEMRSRQDERTLPVTARSLETVIRLATAHAKARLSLEVEAEPDCAVAMDILSFALYHENHYRPNEAPKTAPTPAEPKGEKRPEVSDSEAEDDADESIRKKLRFGQPDNVDPIAADLRRRIYDEVNKSADGEIKLVDLCADLDDRDAVKVAVDALVKEDRLMLADGVVYPLE
jgi:DNA replication licensing factor MCM3